MTKKLDAALERFARRKQAVEDSQARLDPWKLRLWRTARGMTHRQLVVESGYTITSNALTSKVELYQRPAGPVMLRRLATALDVPEDELLSFGAEFRANKVECEAWLAAGSPSLPEWVKSRAA